MAELSTLGLMSADGYVVDAGGSFEWAAPDAETHAFVNEIAARDGTQLLGRRTYDVMAVWDTIEDDAPEMVAFARLWRAQDKVVYSRTLDRVDAPRTRLEGEFDADAVRRLVRAADRPVSIGGPTLAAQAFRAGLISTAHVFLQPVLIGGGTPFWPTGVRLDLELRQQRRFAGGTVYLEYRVRG